MSIHRSVPRCQFGGQNQSQNSAYYYQAEFDALNATLGRAGGAK